MDERTNGSVTAVRPVRITGMASIPVLTLIVPREVAYFLTGLFLKVVPFSDAKVMRELITLKFDWLGRVSHPVRSSLSTHHFLPFFRFFLIISFDITWCGRCFFCYPGSRRDGCGVRMTRSHSRDFVMTSCMSC